MKSETYSICALASDVRLPLIAIAAALAAFSIAPATAKAQRATQIVRFSVTGSTEASISSASSGSSLGGGGGGGGWQQASSYSPPTSGAFSSKTSADASPAPKLAQGRVVQRTGRDSTGRASSASVTSVPVWQAEFTITNSEPNKKVAVSLDSPMPEGADLTLELGASHGAVTAGMVVLGTTGSDALTSMPAGKAAVIPLGIGIAAAPGTSAGSKRVNFTLVTGA